MSDMVALSRKIKRIILDQSMRAHVGHIGSALSIADIIAVLYGSFLNIESPDDANRDRLVLSKGHAALALYAGLSERGWINAIDLNTYCADSSFLGVHPEHNLTGIDFSSGSLGQGLSIGAGAAFAARLQKSTRRVVVVMSDAECNEGAVWEAIMFSAHHELSNLVVIIDLNNQQAFGYTKDIINLSPMRQRWEAFGWDAHDVDGHDVEAMDKCLSSLNFNTGAPHVLIAHTTFGKGVSYMENQIKWHYWPMSQDQYTQAVMEVEAK